MKIALLMLMLLMFAVSASAVTYTWVDDQGTTNFTEDYGQIPKKYRKKAKVLGGGEEEPPPAAEPERKESAKPKSEAAPEVKEQPPAESKEKKQTEFGGKEGSVWRAEFGRLKADLRASEDQLVDLRKRVADTSNMSRTEFLSIQNSLKNLESRILSLRQKLDALTESANKAKVPEEYR